MTNERLRARREAIASPADPDGSMSRAELAHAVNEYVRVKTGRASVLRASEIGRYERGEVRWPSKLYREAMRAVLEAGSDEELGFSPTPRGSTVSRAGRARAADAQGPVLAQRLDRVSASNAQIIARAVVVRRGEALVARRRGESRWFLPGGPVESAESVRGVLLRELARQAGVAARIVRFAGAVEHQQTQDSAHHVITLAFDAEIVRFEADWQDPGLETQWVALAELVEHRVSPHALSKALIGGTDGPFWRALTR